MNRRFFRCMLWLSVFGLSACHGSFPEPDQPLHYRLERSPGPVKSGKAFEFRLIQTWRRDLKWETLPAELFSPLKVREVARKRSRNGDWLQERVDYLAYAFGGDRVQITPWLWQARDPATGERHRFQGDAFFLEVLPALTPGSSKTPEVPGEPFPPPSAPWPWPQAFWLLGVALAALAALRLWKIRRRPQAKSIRLRKTAPFQAAWSELKDLQAFRPETKAEHEAFYVRGTLLLRRYLSDRFHLPATCMTSDELIRGEDGSPWLGIEERRQMAPCLIGADLVKFAQSASSAEERQNFLKDLEAVLLDSKHWRRKRFWHWLGLLIRRRKGGRAR
ncbi:MAG: hypothetical protein DWQ01_19415 [Planctomycetota bacterium]|nr:MAG: hypothetical protein DWQ01_19415 [Planctomycetota bacterium]